MNVYTDREIDQSLIAKKTVAIIGYGSQGHAHALNLRDSGINVVVGGVRDGVSWGKALADGFTVCEAREAAKRADIVMLLVPDEVAGRVYVSDIQLELHPGNCLAVAHGFNIHFKKIIPPQGVNVFMVAPKGPGHLVRSQYVKGEGVPCLVAVAADPSGDTLKRGLAYAGAIGGGRAAVLETTFRDETETDLFGEQAVLCGGLTELIKAGFETLVEAGYSPELAYFECVHEVKLIVDLIYEGGIANMRYSISNTAEYGDLTRGKRVIGSEARQAMKKLLSDIQNGTFAQEWIEEFECGLPHFRELRKEGEKHAIEKVGKRMRALMPWLAQQKLVDKNKN